jgi:predicted RNA binding protein with dsRBD fold (UPF0201 family)
VGERRTTFDPDYLGGAGPRAKRRTRHEKKMERFGPRTEGPRFARVPLKAEVTVRAPVHATEDRARVEAAVRALFPDARFERAPQGGGVAARAVSLGRFAEVLRSTRIRDAAREVLKGALGPDGAIRVRLNKQAAAAGHVNFALAGGEVLGPIEVELRAPDPDALIEVLTWIDGESDERLYGTRVRAAARAARERGQNGPPR